jgi:hypothetical protein
VLKIYNSLTRDKQDFVPVRPGLGLGLAQRGAGRGAGRPTPSRCHLAMIDRGRARQKAQ